MEGGGIGIVSREAARRSGTVAEADKLLDEGRIAYSEGNYEAAKQKYTASLNSLPGGLATEDRRRTIEAHLVDGTVAHAQTLRRVGNYQEAREGLEQILAVDPQNEAVKQELEYLDDPIRTNPALNYEHTGNVDKLRRNLYTAEGYKNLGFYDKAIAEYEMAFRLDPHNAAARRGLESVQKLKSDYYRSAYDETRSKLLAQVDQAWEMAVPPAIEEQTKALEELQASTGLESIQFKPRNIIIPKIDFDDTTVEEALDFLRQRSRGAGCV